MRNQFMWKWYFNTSAAKSHFVFEILLASSWDCLFSYKTANRIEKYIK